MILFAFFHPFFVYFFKKYYFCKAYTIFLEKMHTELSWLHVMKKQLLVIRLSMGQTTAKRTLNIGLQHSFR